MHLFSNIKFLRKQASMTQGGFGLLLNKSLQTISAYEHGTAEPDINSLITISKHFKITIHDLIELDLSKNENYNINLVSEPPPQYESAKELPAAVGDGDEVMEKKVALLIAEVSRMNARMDLMEAELGRLKRKK